MGRLTRCKICNKLLNTINEISQFGDHGWKFQCCGTQYFQCNRATCKHSKKLKKSFFYQDSEQLNNHVEIFHKDQEEEIPINLNDYIESKVLTTSYQESSSLQKYFNENYCIEEKSFPYGHQRDAIKKIITMACSKKEGVISISKTISNSSFQIFFAIAQIAFLENELVINI